LKSPTHWFCKTLFAVYVLAIFWTSLAYAFEHKVAATRIPSSAALFRVASPRGRLKIRAYVEDAAKTRGVNPQVAEWIVRHESGHYPEVTGDGGESRGLWQINKAWHPEVSDACAYNVSCSTDWSLERIRAGHVDEWSTWKYCKERFKDCPK
jgi:Lysozyme like domain